MQTEYSQVDLTEWVDEGDGGANKYPFDVL